jgi:hypothetical protein
MWWRDSALSFASHNVRIFPRNSVDREMLASVRRGTRPKCLAFGSRGYEIVKRTREFLSGRFAPIHFPDHSGWQLTHGAIVKNNARYAHAE